MKYRITLDIKNPLESEDGRLHIVSKHEYIDERSLIFLEEIIQTTLESFKKADEKAFTTHSHGSPQKILTTPKSL